VWQSRAKHCPQCGALFERATIEGRPRNRCAQCAFILYENPASAAAGLVLDDTRRVLLVRRAIEPYKGHWALPAGYQEMDETPSETAAREIREESGITVEIIALFDLLFVREDHRPPSNLAVFLCAPSGGELRPGDDVLDAAWFDLRELPADLGFENGPRILERLRDARRRGELGRAPVRRGARGDGAPESRDG
jgi:ADP-ribose pyrophosphatase YjhB (NUDIX family)